MYIADQLIRGFLLHDYLVCMKPRSVLKCQIAHHLQNRLFLWGYDHIYSLHNIERNPVLLLEAAQSLPQKLECPDGTLRAMKFESYESLPLH